VERSGEPLLVVSVTWPGHMGGR